jgi:hypothetical protein
MRLRPIRTKKKCLRSGASFVPFRPSCVAHMPFLRRLRVAWMVICGMDLSQYDIDCGGHRIEQVQRGVEQTRSPAIIAAMRNAVEAFGGDDEVKP